MMELQNGGDLNQNEYNSIYNEDPVTGGINRHKRSNSTVPTASKRRSLWISG